MANAVGERLDTSVAVQAFDGTGDDESGFVPARFARLAESRCDVIMGFPVPRESPWVPESLEATDAYAAIMA
ncbi:hypothetical protein [Arhodomonas sp. AD133]|uniref:hypothetical protein n=1 Tax=Arhodomonas sp. AD133 TaxID=3415009 RepID=UPI003EB7415A